MKIKVNPFFIKKFKNFFISLKNVKLFKKINTFLKKDVDYLQKILHNSIRGKFYLLER